MVDDYGYYYNVLWTGIYQGHMPNKFSVSNKYTIKNINNFLKINRNGEYFVLEDQNIQETHLLTVVHKKCNNVFNASWAELKGKMSKM